jgi:hypothetical protein
MMKPLVPNWVVAGALAVFVGGAYAYTMKAVGSSDLSELAEMEKKSKDAKK